MRRALSRLYVKARALHWKSCVFHSLACEFHIVFSFPLDAPVVKVDQVMQSESSSSSGGGRGQKCLQYPCKYCDKTLHLSHQIWHETRYRKLLGLGPAENMKGESQCLFDHRKRSIKPPSGPRKTSRYCSCPLPSVRCGRDRRTVGNSRKGQRPA